MVSRIAVSRQMKCSLSYWLSVYLHSLVFAHFTPTHLWCGYRGSRLGIKCRHRQRSDIPAKPRIHLVLAAGSPTIELSGRERQTLVTKLHYGILDCVLTLCIDRTPSHSHLLMPVGMAIPFDHYERRSSVSAKTKAMEYLQLFLSCLCCFAAPNVQRNRPDDAFH